MPYTIRPLTIADKPFLWEMLYEAIYVPDGEQRPSREVLALPTSSPTTYCLTHETGRLRRLMRCFLLFCSGDIVLILRRCLRLKQRLDNGLYNLQGMMPMTKPQTKSQFIRWLQTERDSWEGLLDQLSEAEMIAPNRLNEWSVKDVIAHIMSYEQFIVERVLELVRGEVYQPSETPEALTDFAERYGYPDFGSPLLDDDLPNAWVFQKYHSRSLKDVLALEKQTFIKLLQAVEQLSDKQLIATGIYEKLAQNTYIHYQEHAADILAMQNSQITIRPATLADAEKYSQLRLEALCEHPEAFGSDYQVNRQKSPTDWEAQLTQRIDGENAMLFFACADDELVGMTGIFRGNSPKARHNGGIWGVYVRAAYRGQGIATRLLEACIAWAADQQIEYLKLAVVTTNVAAIRCYAACGFRVYGLEPKVLRVNGVDYDELWMVREIESPVP